MLACSINYLYTKLYDKDLGMKQDDNQLLVTLSKEYVLRELHLKHLNTRVFALTDDRAWVSMAQRLKTRGRGVLTKAAAERRQGSNK